MARSVFIRGAGAITPFGETWKSSLATLTQGLSAIRTIESFDATGFPSTAAAEIPIKNDETEDRRLLFVEKAISEALAMLGGWKPSYKRLGIFIGAESGRANFRTVIKLAQAAGGGEYFDYAKFGIQARNLTASMDNRAISPAAVASRLARKFEATGPVQTISLACSSGSTAIAEAARAIRIGLCDFAICGGVGADVDQLMLAGFGKIGALSSRGQSCPFDVRRDGFVVGEGAAMFVLSAEKADAQVELIGEGKSLDAFHLTAPDPTGAGAERAMRSALLQAGITEVDYVQAHGTSTLLNDEIEVLALRRVFGERITTTPVSSIKGALGHWIAGAGALGVLCGWEAVISGTLLPTAGLSEPDPKCNLLHIQGKAIQRKTTTCLINSFAFGGANCSLVLRRCG